MPFLVAVLIGVVVVIVVGVLVALRRSHPRVSLAIVTLALSLVFSVVIFENSSMTGGFGRGSSCGVPRSWAPARSVLHFPSGTRRHVGRARSVGPHVRPTFCWTDRPQDDRRS